MALREVAERGFRNLAREQQDDSEGVGSAGISNQLPHRYECNIRYVAYGAIDWDNAEARQLIEQLMPDKHSVPGAKTPTALD